MKIVAAAKYMLIQAMRCALIVALSLPVAIHAEMLPLENNDLDQIAGNGGFSMAIKNVQVFEFINTFRYCGSDNGYIQLDNIKIHDGSGGPYHLNYDFGTPTTSTGILYFDIGEPTVASDDDWTGSNPTSIRRGMTAVSAPNWSQDITYTVGNYVFGTTTASSGVDLGELELGPIGISSFEYYYAPPIGGAGINWEHDFQLNIDHATYAYQINPPNCKKIMLTNLYMGESFSDLAGDDPRFPTTWKPNNNVDYGQFKIGDLFGDLSNNIPSNPAKFAVGETATGSGDPTYPGLGMAVLSTPLIGSVRFENVLFGGVDFGPGAIDGIHAYRMEIQLIP